MKNDFNAKFIEYIITVFVVIFLIVGIVSYLVTSQKGSNSSIKLMALFYGNLERVTMIDQFYQNAADASYNKCNFFGSCGNPQDQAIWNAFKEFATFDPTFDNSMTTGDYFNQTVFQIVLQRTRKELTFEYRQSWFTAENKLIQKLALKQWKILASEYNRPVAE